MVQYTNILIASAVAATVPALAAPFAYIESREIENIDAREPVFGAIYDIATTGAARRVVTAPLKKTAHDAANQHPVRGGPGPAQHAMNKILQEQKAKEHAQSFDVKRAAAHAASKNKIKRSFDFEDLDTREPVFGAIYDIATTGAARRVVTAPLKKTAHDAANQHPVHAGPSAAHQAMNKIQQDQKASAHAQSFDAKRAAAHAASKNKIKRSFDFEDLDTREPVLGAIYDIATTGAARRVVTAPLKKTAHDAANQQPVRGGPGPAQQAMNKIKQDQKAKEHAQSFDAKRAAAHAASKKKRDLEDLLERDIDEFYLD